MLLVYAKEQNVICQQLADAIMIKGEEDFLERYDDLEALCQRLHKPRLNLKIGVLAIDSPAELDRILTVKDQLADMRLVVLLADKDEQTLTKVHALAPRFITFTDAGVEPLSSVVEKMMACQVGPAMPTAASERTVHT